MTEGRKTVRRWSGGALGRILLLATSLSALAAPLSAQVHRSRVPTAEILRAEYLAEVGKGVQETLSRFRAAVEAADAAAVTRLFTDAALYSPTTGESHYGAEAIRTAFQARLAEVGPVLLTRVDFSASGGLAYQFGRYVYGAGPGGTGREEGTYVLVFYQDGRDWKIRSLVERENPAY